MNNKTAKTVYSIDEETFNHNELDDAVRDAIDSYFHGTPVGETITIWQGTTVPNSAGYYAPSFIVDDMSNCAYDDCGDHADDWPNCSAEQKNELGEKIKDVINEWADTHGLQPNFYNVVDVVEIEVRVLNDGGDWELVA